MPRTYLREVKRYFEDRMRKGFHLVVAVVMSLLVMQPVLGVASCLSTIQSRCAAACPMSGAGSECPMAQSHAAKNCPPDCCGSPSQATVQVGPLEKTKVFQLAPVVLLPVGLGEPKPPAGFEFSPAPGDSPPLYKLLRVFRI